MYSFRRTEGRYDGRPVAAGSTPSKLISAKSSASTNASITRTGLLSSMKSSRHSGSSVHCPRSASSTKRPINLSQESRENHNSGTAFSHSQGQSRQFGDARATSALPPIATKQRTSRDVSNVPTCDIDRRRDGQLKDQNRPPEGGRSAQFTAKQ